MNCRLAITFGLKVHMPHLATGGTVESLNYNFEGKSYVNVKVGVETVLRAYENYTFIKED
nr:MAG TPA: hypothetical protein [Caudoviricetes sp.]